MAKKKKYIKKSFESLGNHFTDYNGKTQTDTSANIYESMLQSPAFYTLNCRQKHLYLLCKAQYYGKKKPSADYPDIEQIQPSECFYLCKHDLVKKYHFCTQNCDKELYGYTKNNEHVKGLFEVLEEHGLIEILVHNKATKKKNIYKLSDKWITWTPK